MEVYILCYKGIFYGVYSSWSAAYTDAEEQFGVSVDVAILQRTVK